MTYYVFIMALTVYYFILSFQSHLPWTYCDESWAGEGQCNGSQLVGNQSVPEQFYL